MHILERKEKEINIIIEEIIQSNTKKEDILDFWKKMMGKFQSQHLITQIFRDNE